MTLTPYQQEVLKEKVELDKKAFALTKFIGLSEEFAALDAEEQELLKEQNDIMWQYSEVLGKRIWRWHV